MTGNDIDFYHTQSYLFALKGRALTSSTVRNFWNEMPEYSYRDAVIRNCEQMQLHVYNDGGIDHEVLFPLIDVVRLLPSDKIDDFNPTRDAYRELMDAGFPFFKADLIYRHGIYPILPDWVDNDKMDILAKQFQELIDSRREVKVHNYNKYRFLRRVIGDSNFQSVRRIIAMLKGKTQPKWP